VTLVGSLLEDLELNQDMFDCITLFDVIEHLPSPLASLQKLALHLLPGGALLISTGNTDVVPWRLMRRHYWYYYTDHVSFFNPGWFDWAARRLDLSLERVKKFSRNGGSIWGRWRQFAQCLAFWTVQNTAKWPAVLVKLITAIYPFNRVGQWPEPPMANLWPDHILVVLKSKK
jgi:SAM-dependent methyltransferase